MKEVRNECDTCALKYNNKKKTPERTETHTSGIIKTAKKKKGRKRKQKVAVSIIVVTIQHCTEETT